jgi:hypothetical protein
VLLNILIAGISDVHNTPTASKTGYSLAYQNVLQIREVSKIGVAYICWKPRYVTLSWT